MSAVTPRFDYPAEYHRHPTLGGGDGYDPDNFEEPSKYRDGDRVHREDADHIVSDPAELRSVVDALEAGDVVWVANGMRIDPGEEPLIIRADDVTIAGGRGLTEDYAVITGDSYPTRVFDIRAEGVRITSIGMEGPETERWELADRDLDEIYDENSKYITNAITVNGKYAEIDNIAFRGWGNACVEVGLRTYANWCHIHHVELLDTPTPGLGYGVIVYHGFPRVQHFYADNNRHAIAGDGAPDCSYRIMNFLIGEHTRSHCLDMHSGAEVSSRWPDQGGRQVHIQNGVILATMNCDAEGVPTSPQEAIGIRAAPAENGTIEGIKFAHPHRPPLPTSGTTGGEAWRVDGVSSMEEAGIRAENNLFGFPEKDVDVIGIQPDVDPSEPVVDDPDPLPVADETPPPTVEPTTTPDPEFVAAVREAFAFIITGDGSLQ